MKTNLNSRLFYGIYVNKEYSNYYIFHKTKLINELINILKVEVEKDHPYHEITSSISSYKDFLIGVTFAVKKDINVTWRIFNCYRGTGI